MDHGFTGTTDHPEIDALLEEHREAKRLLSVVEGRLGVGGTPASEWASGVAAALVPLMENLRMHFASEERGCLHTEVPVMAPHLATHCARLLEEHAQILQGFERSLERLRLLAEEHIGDAKAVSKRVRMVIATLRRHEAEENELLMNAFWEDLGAKD
ncbi:MAG: hypothetical protein AMXMBFR64_36810 [Myxococcales bacterium]